MSMFKLSCGHTVDGHSIIPLTVEGINAFRIWQKYYGKKTFSYIIEKGGGFKQEYISSSDEDFGGGICTSCLSEWSVYRIRS